MRKIVIKEKVITIDLSAVNEATPIFAKRDGKLEGMLVKDLKGWILKTGGHFGATGHHSTREECIKSCLVHEYEFYVED